MENEITQIKSLLQHINEYHQETGHWTTSSDESIASITRSLDGQLLSTVRNIISCFATGGIGRKMRGSNGRSDQLQGPQQLYSRPNNGLYYSQTNPHALGGNARTQV